MAASQKEKATTLQSWRAKGAITAQGRIGHTVDFLLKDIERQKLAADFVGGQNLAFAFQKTQFDRKVAQAARGSRIASARDYIKTTYLDPVKPMKKKAPGFGQYALGMASSALAGYSAYGGIESMRLEKGLAPGGWDLFGSATNAGTVTTSTGLSAGTFPTTFGAF